MIENVKCEQILKRHLQLITKRIRNWCPEVRAIVLYGGYGRNEGSWYTDENDEATPYNDYDLLVVVKQKSELGDIQGFRHVLATEIGIRWIDIGIKTTSTLSRLRPTIYNYDLKYASKVIYGDKNVLQTIPDIDAKTLPMQEAQTLFFTRLYALVGSLDHQGLDQDLTGDASRFFRNQMAKATLAVVDVLLLAKGAYDSSYRSRVYNVATLYPQKTEFIALSRWALNEKLWPQSPDMSAHEIHRMYEEVHHHYMTEMYLAVGQYFRKRVKEPQDIDFYMKWLPTNILKRIYWALKYRNFNIEKKTSILLAQCYIVAAWDSDNINENYLRKGVALLRQVDSNIPTELSWDEARMEAARLRMVA